MDVMVFYKSRLRVKGNLYGQLLVTTGLGHGRLKLLVVNWAAQLITSKTRMLPCKYIAKLNLMYSTILSPLTLYMFIFLRTTSPRVFKVFSHTCNGSEMTFDDCSARGGLCAGTGIEVTCGTSQISSGLHTLATIFILLISFLVTIT